ncbi:hypothetical protein M409DRAFT_25000 [Zasmidium cellare ATCC 36951]|uniref:Amidohydrolase-related domain-containing protein n=1 Tax=Zasmidium cellare ATCC 36951 TaxID=1080233 RepID=A0A6A6CBR1_ZASCE|nr:uncharacterized protein M409DRAFT_25000 [Zasmidium cellare ATCC 36951]KAF2164604.1 hypothetical protein M409DRAFT_25000 [Zasmidium cellare ATCC 36951]
MSLKLKTRDTFTIHTDCLFDPKQKKFVKDTSIDVNPTTGLITKVYQRETDYEIVIASNDIDLRGKCVLPGLVDAHTHIFLHSYKEASSIYQMRDESIIERTIRATNHCRTALLAGYTTYRDLGTEGAQDADVHVRDAVNRGLIPGPRIFCATECLASSGGYEVRQENVIGGTFTPRISDPCDGVPGVRAGVRRRLAAGADIIKFYADYRKRTLRFPAPAYPGCPDIHFPPPETSGPSGIYNQRNPNLLLFRQDEMDEMVQEAKAARAPVAAHAQSAEAVMMAARAGVTTIEHGPEPMDGTDAMAMMKKNGVIWVPTIAVFDSELPPGDERRSHILKQVKTAYDYGVKLACGGDTGAFPHGENVREMELMLKAGVPLEEVLLAATLTGWEACGGDWCGKRFGWWEEGCAADIVALDGDVREDVGALRRVGFVMKDGRVWKREGVAVGMV